MIEEIKSPLPGIQYIDIETKKNVDSFKKLKEKKLKEQERKALKEKEERKLKRQKAKENKALGIKPVRKKETQLEKILRKKREKMLKHMEDMRAAIDRGKKRVRKEYYVTDVAFNTDPSIIQDFADYEHINYELAETVLIAFFEELKAQLIDGKVIYVSKIGKFFVAAPYRNELGGFSIPDPNRCKYSPRLQGWFPNKMYDKRKEEIEKIEKEEGEEIEKKKEEMRIQIEEMERKEIEEMEREIEEMERIDAMEKKKKA
jgi:hypothetical protein